MQQLDVWGWSGDNLHKLSPGTIDFASQLTDWLGRYPRLLQTGLVIVGRRLALDGERLDLLALDDNGRWTVIKIAPDLLTRAHLTLALQQAAALNALPFNELESRVNAYLAHPVDGGAATLAQLLAARNVSRATAAAQRDIQIYLVGSGQEAGLPQLIAYMNGRCHFPLYTVIYSLYEHGRDQRFIIRQQLDPTPAPARPAEAARPYNWQAPITIPTPPPPARGPTTDIAAPPAAPAAVIAPPDEPPSAIQQATRWAVESASQVWRRAQEMAGLTPPDLQSSLAQRPEAAALLRMADAGEIGDSLRYLLKMAEQQPLLPIFGEGSIQFSPPNGRQALFTARARAEKNKPGYMPLLLHFDALAETYQLSDAELSKIFWRQGRRDITFSETRQFVKSFRKLTKK